MKRNFSCGQVCGILCESNVPKATMIGPTGAMVGVLEMDCCPAYCCQHSISIYKGGDLNDKTLWRKISKCEINCHCCCSVQCCGSIGRELEFNCVDVMGNPQEVFKKVHSGYCRECCTAADAYELTLPSDEGEGALMLAAVQFIDMLYFENPWGCCCSP